MMTDGKLLRIFDSARPGRLLVLGDLILDQYIVGDADRVSQEAPILVLHAAQTESRLGGAANVCHMLRGIGAEVICAGVVGRDVAGQQMHELLSAAGIVTHMVLRDPQRPTTVKQRFVGRTDGRNAHQILRVDHEIQQPLARHLEEQLFAEIEKLLPQCDGVLVSDYGKGVCTPWLLERLIAAARARRLPVLVDPLRGSDYRRYRGATLLKPNRVETSAATGIAIRSPADALAAAERLCELLELELAVVTLDRDGMALFERGRGGRVFPTQARAVYDITGAGDMVLAMLGAMLAGGVAPQDAIELANVAAGLEVEQEGVAVISRAELRRALEPPVSGNPKIVSREQAAELARQYRERGLRIAFTNGCFDLLHAGHVLSLTEAARQGDVLFVGVNSDEVIRRLKGPQRPIISQHDRMAVLAALQCVQHVVLFEEETPHELLHAIQPDVLVKGGTYNPDEVVGREIVQAYGGRIHVTGVAAGLSTTRIVESVLERAA